LPSNAVLVGRETFQRTGSILYPFVILKLDEEGAGPEFIIDDASSGGTNVFKSVRFAIVIACALLLNENDDDGENCSESVVENMDRVKSARVMIAHVFVFL
jgi:hypothetical protein